MSGDQAFGKEEKEIKDEGGIKFIFEPSLEEVFNFFDAEIVASLLQQTFHESRLAKLASRLLLLDRSIVKVEEALGKAVHRKQAPRS